MEILLGFFFFFTKLFWLFFRLYCNILNCSYARLQNVRKVINKTPIPSVPRKQDFGAKREKVEKKQDEKRNKCENVIKQYAGKSTQQPHLA